MSKKLLPIESMRTRYQRVDRTITRWVDDGILPAPIIIRGRRYWDEAELEERERSGMGREPAKAKPEHSTESV